MSCLNTVFSCRSTVSFSSTIGFHPLCSLFHISGDRLHQTFDSSVFCNIKDSQCVNSSSPSNRFQQNRWNHAPAFCFSTKKANYSTVSCISGGTMLILPHMHLKISFRAFPAEEVSEFTFIVSVAISMPSFETVILYQNHNLGNR